MGLVSGFCIEKAAEFFLGFRRLSQHREDGDEKSFSSVSQSVEREDDEQTAEKDWSGRRGVSLQSHQ